MQIVASYKILLIVISYSPSTIVSISGPTINDLYSSSQQTLGITGVGVGLSAHSHMNIQCSDTSG